MQHVAIVVIYWNISQAPQVSLQLWQAMQSCSFFVLRSLNIFAIF